MTYRVEVANAVSAYLRGLEGFTREGRLAMHATATTRPAPRLPLEVAHFRDRTPVEDHCPDRAASGSLLQQRPQVDLLERQGR